MITFPALSLNETMVRLAAFNRLTNFGLTREDFEVLTTTAPPWPVQPGHIRALRLRNRSQRHPYYQRNGLYPDINAHLHMLDRTYGTALRKNDSTKHRTGRIVHLSAFGGAGGEWVIIDLFANRNAQAYNDRPSPRFGWQQQPPANTCAGELFCAAWLLPEVFNRLSRVMPGTTWFIDGHVESNDDYGTTEDMMYSASGSAIGVKHGVEGLEHSHSVSGEWYIPTIITPPEVM